MYDLCKAEFKETKNNQRLTKITGNKSGLPQTGFAGNLKLQLKFPAFENQAINFLWQVAWFNVSFTCVT